MGRNKKNEELFKQLFNEYSKSAIAAGIAVTNELLVCPLCWRDTHYDDFSLEHVLPGSVGGNRFVLTCTQCNNKHGTLYDAHLAQFQKTKDGFDGHGTIPAKLEIRGKKVVANIEWGDGFKNIYIVGEASNPAEVNAIQEAAAAGRFGELHLTLNYGYKKNRFQTGLLRCAYLALFKRFGYQYVKTDAVQILRRRICDINVDHPRLGSLIGELRNGTLPYRGPYIIVPGNVNGVQFYMVAIRLKRETETYHFVFMPVPVKRADAFYEMMERCSKDNDGIKLTIPRELVFT